MTIRLGTVSLTSTPALADFQAFNTAISPRAIDLCLFFMTIDTDPILWTNYAGYAASVNANSIATQTSTTRKISDFTGGSFDSAGLRGNRGLAGLATDAAALAVPIILRPFHEFNITHTSYGVGKETAAQYVAGWRHWHDLFTSLGVSNVQWMWAPNVWGIPSETGPIDPTIDDGSGSSWYPGDAYVDYVAIDGYMTTTLTTAHPPSEIYLNAYQKISALTAKPFAISEFGCAEQARLSIYGGKAGWYDLFFSMIKTQMPSVTLAVQWEQNNSPNDYRISSGGSDTTAAAEFVKGVTAPRFAGATDPLYLLETSG